MNETDESAVGVRQRYEISRAGDVIIAVSIIAVMSLGAAIMYQLTIDAPAEEIRATVDLANTLGIAGLIMFAGVEIPNAVIGK